MLAAELPRRPSRARRRTPLEVVAADALRATRLPGPAPTALVANLPYNVAVPVLLHLLERLPRCAGLVMVQAEVADRLAAPPGSRTYGVPSVKAAWYGEVRRAGAVGRRCSGRRRTSSPASSRLRREPPPGDRRDFAVVDAAFAQRRKTLRAALAGWAGFRREAERLLRAAGVDPGLRGERLDVDGLRPGGRGPRRPTLTARPLRDARAWPPTLGG